MPELPEVETVARQLAPRLAGRVVRRLEVYDPRLRRSGPPPSLAGRKIRSVRRSGKQVLFEFGGVGARGTPLWLAVHLRMTGRLIYGAPPADAAPGHLRARFELDRGTLCFVDTRRFGTFRWATRAERLAPQGLDPLASDTTPVRLRELARGSRQNVKAWLLRQDRLVGLGNIYASEILWRARIAPRRRAGALRPREIERLHAAMRAILERAIRFAGTTFSDFQDARGEEGAFQRFLAVYGREGRPCRRCRTPIRRRVQQQRSTFWCPSCQR